MSILATLVRETAPARARAYISRKRRSPKEAGLLLENAASANALWAALSTYSEEQVSFPQEARPVDEGTVPKGSVVAPGHTELPKLRVKRVQQMMKRLDALALSGEIVAWDSTKGLFQDWFESSSKEQTLWDDLRYLNEYLYLDEDFPKIVATALATRHGLADSYVVATEEEQSWQAFLVSKLWCDEQWELSCLRRCQNQLQVRGRYLLVGWRGGRWPWMTTMR